MKVYLVQCLDEVSGYVLGVYEDEADAIARKISADRAPLCRPHEIVLQYTIASKVNDTEGGM